MCNPVAIGLMAASVAVDQKNQRSATKRTNNQIALHEERNDKFNKKIIDTSDESVKQYKPETRIENLNVEQAKSEKSLTEALTTARDNQDSNSIAAQGKVSNKYTTDKAERALQRTKAGVDLAKMISKVGAPTTLTRNESMENAQASSVIGNQKAHRVDMARAGGVDIRKAGELNQSMKLISGLLRGAAMAYSGGAAGASSGAGASGSTAISSSSYGGAVA